MTGTRSGTKFLARLAVTAALLAAVTWRLDLAGMAAKASRLAPGWIAGAFVVVFAAVALSAWKWRLILAARGRPLPYVRLVRHYFVGLFFNNVLPTTVGGDAVRAWETTRDTGEIPEAVGSVITERLVAGAALGVTALLGVPFVDATPRLLLVVVTFLAVDVALVALFLAPRVAERVAASILPARLQRARDTVAAVVRTVGETIRMRRLVVRVFVLSVAFQVLVAAVNACLFAAMGLPPSLARCVVYTPMIFTITMLPVSVSGLGVREAAYAYFFGQAGVARADAVTVSLLFFVVVGLASVPGAPLFALGRLRPDRAPE
ncbi:MAG TPA: lysylphosphatidylglycerol synthase transmembrane domain-containing protein [Anaeromyxobacteraceae bacterium]|nr:lysylphosphatidylglycerol synthase transmembrane domain-containing protein [Anaeromyxobacteraceae bacterium]